MEPSAAAKKRRQDAPSPVTPTTHATMSGHKQASQQDRLRRPVSGKIRTAKDSSEIIRARKFADSYGDTSVDDSTNGRYTVTEVGAGGTLYLKPSRVPPPSFIQAPATPPPTSHGEDQRQSNVSGTWTPHLHAARSAMYEHPVPVPPLSLANAVQKRRPRSHSFSTITASERERMQSPTFDSNDFQLLVNGRETDGRPKSSVDLTGGFLDLQIPHYRLGTPRFSERGTAYLHNSMYTATPSEDMRSSYISRAEYDKLFPAPPGKSLVGPASMNASSPYLHPSAAQSIAPSRTPPTQTPSPSPSTGGISGIFERVEANVNDPAIVRYNAKGRIAAATPARLVAQITSPIFLDYELLSDFFLTFRNFMTCRDLLEHLLARMRWAIGTTTDAGRIVRVRTFVALRHWILNYFSDDFLPDIGLRQRFCDLVNDMTLGLRKRPNQPGSDLNIIGELKKCWRRTCASYWPLEDAFDTSAEADIVPGEDKPISEAYGSVASAPSSLRMQTTRQDFRRRSMQIPVEEPMEVPRIGFAENMRTVRPSRSSTRTASIPASPMSEQSLQILSCSVPFLRHNRPRADRKSANARPPGPQRNPPISSKNPRPSHQHKRSGSFSDALRDGRAPLPSMKAETIELHALPATTFVGGLVRGLLLQPCPPRVELLMPISPAPEQGMNGVDEGYFDRSGNNLGVKRLVGDVRRALSSRHRREGSPVRSYSSHRSTASSGSQRSVNVLANDRSGPTSAWQQLRGPPRIDTLALKISRSYDEAFLEVNLPNPANEQAPSEPLQPPHLASSSLDRATQEELASFGRPRAPRLDSQFTTGSRSILIVDDTGSGSSPKIPSALPSVSSWSSVLAQQALFRSPDEVLREIAGNQPAPSAAVPGPSSNGAVRTSEPGVEEPSLEEYTMHDILTMPGTWQPNGVPMASGGSTPPPQRQARKSSDVHSPTMDDLPTHHQLRRRPGGDLKAADHVHELQPRPQTPSMSTIDYSAHTSLMSPNDLSGTHFSGQDLSAWRFPRVSALNHRKTNPVSLIEMEPALRPSFQAEVSKLSNLPDRSRAGGIEDTLRRLEGQTDSNTSSMLLSKDTGLPAPSRERLPPQLVSVEYATAPPNASPGPQALISPRTETQGASIFHPSGPEALNDWRVQSIGSSGALASSQAQSSTAPALGADAPMPDSATSVGDQTQWFSKSVSFAHLRAEDTSGKSTKSDQPKPTTPKQTTPQGSFLLDDNESLSDISTDIADQSEEESAGVRSFFFDDTADDDEEDVQPPAIIPPPTPPSTVGAMPDSPQRHRPAALSDSSQHKLKEAQSAPKLLSPNLDRQRRLQHHPSGSPQPAPAEMKRARTEPDAQQPAHVPFVLAFESDIIAEQLLIIEKDALDEVDWKDLIGLNWHQSPPNVRNWVEYLKQADSTGIDIVVARFNLVVKWVVSEIVLTEATSERARCITKYIHVATHCYRLRNYASMYQITLALLSADLARLHHTWALVPAAEKQKLDRLERLCQPLRNFHNLRAEMETSSTEDGCVPFIGLYTHDLMFNAQKPSRIDAQPFSKEPLINFERYQTAATIVKSLLRLIEASSKYIFHPHSEVLSRCLWLAALDDADIVRLTKVLEA